MRQIDRCFYAVHTRRSIFQGLLKNVLSSILRIPDLDPAPVCTGTDIARFFLGHEPSRFARGFSQFSRGDIRIFSISFRAPLSISWSARPSLAWVLVHPRQVRGQEPCVLNGAH